MTIRIEVGLTEGQCGDWPTLNKTLKAAGIVFDGFHHAQAAIVECDPADEQQVRAIIAAHLAPEAVAARAFAETAKQYEAAVQRRLDAAAQSKGYDDIRSAALRAGYVGPFHDEGVAYAQWMDACWAKCYELLAAAQAPNAEIPTVEQVIAQLPLAPQ